MAVIKHFECRFNDIRKQKPHLAKHRWQNIGWYFYEGMATGWMWGAKPLYKKIISCRVRRFRCWQLMPLVN